MKILRGEELLRLEPIFREMNWHLPDSATAFAVVEENEEGEIIAVQMCQLQMTAEPHWEHEGYRGKVNWRKIGRELESIVAKNPFFTGIVIHATGDATCRMAEILGMKKFECTTYVKEVGNVVEAREVVEGEEEVKQ